MNRPNYHHATRQAYRVLIASGVDTLPVDVADLCRCCRNTQVLSFREARHKFDDFEPLCDGPSLMAFTLRRIAGGQIHNLILWNNDEMNRGSGIYRFSLAHELGHIVLRHPDDGCYVEELEANVFAQHLLCPRPVLDVLQPASPQEISYLCGVSMSTARIVASMLRQENRYVDPDIWSKIFAAFSLDEKRSTSDFISAFDQHRLARAHGL